MTREEAIRTAVNWWAKVIVNPKFDNGDKSEIGAMAMMLAQLAVDRNIKEEQIEKFKEALYKRIDEGLNKRIFRKYCFGTDYHPDLLLAEAMEEAGIPTRNAPIKTLCWIGPTEEGEWEVEVSYGYGAPVEKLSKEGK